jgi:hypothetical protein
MMGGLERASWPSAARQTWCGGGKCHTTRSIFGGSSLTLSGEVLHTRISKSFSDFPNLFD